jgi:hypothetical protein
MSVEMITGWSKIYYSTFVSEQIYASIELSQQSITLYHVGTIPFV